VQRFQRQDFQDHQVERTLQQIRFRLAHKFLVESLQVALKPLLSNVKR
jgi:hypothetical protein